MKKSNAHIQLVNDDLWLEPYEHIIKARHDYALKKEMELLEDGSKNLSNFANGHLFFGLHKTETHWVFRDWAPNATEIYLIGDFNSWQLKEEFKLTRLNSKGIWQLFLPLNSIENHQHYKLFIRWNGGEGERIPAWCRRVVQDSHTHLFSAQVWTDDNYEWQCSSFKPNTNPLLIYEAHIGMCVEQEKVGTYNEFRTQIIPRIKQAGYNCIQLMAIQEHPYYGSFGYHVSSFFAPSSRFGTPLELKMLIDEAHKNEIAVIIDLVHSHAIKNINEGLGYYAGDESQFFHSNHRRMHPAWDSLCFDYGKNEVIHFLLSNCKYWLDEFHFDGFRFDGVTSMIYNNHALEQCFTSYNDYFNNNQDVDALCYLTLANKLIHQINPKAISVAEEVSGMPGLTLSMKNYGIGFNYRMAMNIPDYFIKLIKEEKDENWKPSSLFWNIKNRRKDEKTVNYCESHDQALVGDKTLIFRLVDSDMYWHFKQGDQNLTANRGIALINMIKLLTISTINGAYLNFMGNEFGHPEWIDFPRLENNWSHKYARRQWSLRDNKDLCYSLLACFDKEMIGVIKQEKGFINSEITEIMVNDGDQILAYARNNLVFIFNFSPIKSYNDYGFLVSSGAYNVVLNTDNSMFGGHNLTNDSITHNTQYDKLYSKQGKGWLKIYIPARSAVVLKKEL